MECGWDGEAGMEAYCTIDTTGVNVCARSKSGGKCKKGSNPPPTTMTAAGKKLKDDLQKMEDKRDQLDGEKEENFVLEEHTKITETENVAAVAGGVSKFYEYSFIDDGYFSIWRSELNKAMKQSPRRTEDPSEADVLFVGIDYACERDWPHYSIYPKEINYITGDPDTCYNSRDSRLTTYTDKHATYLDLANDADQFCSAASGVQTCVKGVHVVLDMKGYTRVPDSHRKSRQPVIWAAPSWNTGHFRGGHDVSWPSMNVVDFKVAEAKCGGQKYKLVFKGTNDHKVRKNLENLHNGKDVIIKLQEFKGN
jgi:hypothetical protein